MPKKQSTPVWEKTISIAAFVFSAIALFLSWQANQISNKQFTAQTVILSAEFRDGDWSMAKDPDTWGFASCTNKIRFYDFGGASDAIVRYDNIIEYNGKSYTIESDESEAVWSPGIEPYFASLRTEILSENLPMTVEAFTTKEILAKFSFGYDDSLLDLNVSYPYNPSYDYEKNIGPEFSPLTVQFIFYTANGKKLDTGKLICHYFK
jgi:hypothetical protein